MNCNAVADKTREFIAGTLSERELKEWLAHTEVCQDCREARQGAEALRLLKRRPIDEPAEGLFRKLVEPLEDRPLARRPQARFWLGSALGGAVAAALFALLVVSGWVASPAGPAPEEAVFEVALAEPRNMQIAIEARKPLEDASISVMLAGGIALDGFPGKRELNWSTNLEAGVNRLTLPVIANSMSGGRMIVRLQHPDSEQVFVVRIKAEV